MKRIAFCLLCFLLALPVNAQEYDYCAGAGGAVACSAASNEIGNRTAGTVNNSIVADQIHCNLRTPDCSGNINTGYVYGRDNGAGDVVKVCVYLDDGDSAPDSSDTKVACSAEMTFSADYEWVTAAMDATPAVSTGSNYWVCVIAGAGAWVGGAIDEEPASKWVNAAGSYTTPPADLTGSWNTTATQNISAYVTVGD